MSSYITYSEFVNSSFGRDYDVDQSIFSTSGEIQEFLDYICSLVDSHCGRSFGMQEYEQIREGNGTTVMFLDVIPATGVVSIIYSTIGLNATTGEITDYTLFKKSGKIKTLRGNEFLRDYVYTINYSAGYDNIPDPIKLAVMMWANILAQSISNESLAHVDGGSNTQFRFNKFWESYADPRNHQVGDVPPSVWAILKRFVYLK
jgi:hypothetical protein